MADNYTEKAKKALSLAKRISNRLGQNYVGTEHILLGLIREGTGVAAGVINEAGVTEAQIEELIEELVSPSQGVLLADKEGFSPKAEMVLQMASEEAVTYGDVHIGTEHILLALLKMNDCVAIRLLNTLSVSIPRLYYATLSAMGEDVKAHKDDVKDGRIVGAGEVRTPTLEKYSRDLTVAAHMGELDPVVGRDREISRVIQILSRRTKNNPCLVGDPGVGKTAIAEGLAMKIAMGLVPANMLDKRVVTLDLPGMVAGTRYRGEFEERIKKVIAEVIAAGNILLFLDEIHTIIGAGGAEGAIDAANILKPALARGELQLVGATTVAEYRKYFERDAALERRFAPVKVEEPSIDEAIGILKGISHKYEDFHGIKISEEALVAAVKLSERYITDRFLPDKAIDVLDEASAVKHLLFDKANPKLPEQENMIAELERQLEGLIERGDFEEASELNKSLTRERKRYDKLLKKQKDKCAGNGNMLIAEDVAKVVSDWTGVPVTRLTEDENSKLMALEETLHGRVIGQGDAVSAIAKAVRRSRIGLKDPKRPIGSFLFLGPTGVGKTELSKALAYTLFGTEDALIRVDMSEFMEPHSVAKLIGSPPGYVGHDEGGQLALKIRQNPYSILLFDEIEKAHPDVFNVLLQVLDDGHITDSKGRKVNFKNTIIIMTSNVGASRIIEPKKLGFSADSSKEKDYEDMKRGVMEEVKRLFKPEFLNRIDEMVVFHALSDEELIEITGLLLNELADRMEEQLGIKLSVSQEAKKFIAEKGNDKKYGARPLKRAIQSMVEDRICEEILSGKVKREGSLSIGYKGDGLVFTGIMS